MTQTRSVTATFNTGFSAPTGLIYSCGSSGNQVTLSWNAVSGASYYSVRVDDTTKGLNDNPCIGTTGDYCNETVYGTSITVSIISGDSYRWWLHSRDSAGNWSDASHGSNFTCAASSALLENIGNQLASIANAMLNLTEQVKELMGR
jgi:hypothetical protein